MKNVPVERYLKIRGILFLNTAILNNVSTYKTQLHKNCINIEYYNYQQCVIVLKF